MDLKGAVTRRQLLLALASTEALTGVDAAANPMPGLRSDEPASAIVPRLIGDVTPRVGRIHLALPQIAESGNHVPLRLRVDSPMTTADHVRAIHVVGERNPRPWVASFRFGPQSGVADVEMRLRLRDSQTVTAYAQMSDGSCWMQSTRVTVIVGACDADGGNY